MVMLTNNNGQGCISHTIPTFRHHILQIYFCPYVIYALCIDYGFSFLPKSKISLSCKMSIVLRSLTRYIFACDEILATCFKIIIRTYVDIFLGRLYCLLTKSINNIFDISRVW